MTHSVLNPPALLKSTHLTYVWNTVYFSVPDFFKVRRRMNCEFVFKPFHTHTSKLSTVIVSHNPTPVNAVINPQFSLYYSTMNRKTSEHIRFAVTPKIRNRIVFVCTKILYLIHNRRTVWLMRKSYFSHNHISFSRTSSATTTCLNNSKAICKA